MSDITRVALDAMGGDNAPDMIVQGAIDAVNERDDIKVFLVGKPDAIKASLEGNSYPNEQIEIVEATEEIEMAEPPVNAFKKKDFFEIFFSWVPDFYKDFKELSDRSKTDYVN